MIAAALLLLAQPAATATPKGEQTVDCDTTRDPTEQRACAVAEAAAEAAVDQELGLGDQSVPLTPELAEQRARATVREAVKLFCADPQGQEHINRCNELNFETAEMALEEQWEVTAQQMRALDQQDDGAPVLPGYYETVLSAQHAWLAYRDAECAADAALAGRSSGHSVEVALEQQCKTHLTQLRVKQLRGLASQ